MGLTSPKLVFLTNLPSVRMLARKIGRLWRASLCRELLEVGLLGRVVALRALDGTHRKIGGTVTFTVAPRASASTIFAHSIAFYADLLTVVFDARLPAPAVTLEGKSRKS